MKGLNFNAVIINKTLRNHLPTLVVILPSRLSLDIRTNPKDVPVHFILNLQRDQDIAGTILSFEYNIVF